mgnify:FL=1
MAVVSADGNFDIPEGVLTIEADSWEEWGVDKTTVKTVTFPATVASIGECAFFGCSSLVTVSISDSVTSIEPYAFSGCSSLVTVTIPGSVTSIRDGAFSGCSSLLTVTIQGDVTIIGNSAFAACSSLVTLAIPGSATDIGMSAFRKCSSLLTLTIPDGVTYIGYAAFCGCSSLVTLTIPDSVTGIGESAFLGCSSLVTLLFQPVVVGDTQPNARELNKILKGINVARIWASDHVINQLAGPFKDYATLAEVPRVMRAVPDATTWAAVQLYLWWSDPQDDAGQGRVLSKSHQQMVWTVMHVAFRLETTSTSPVFADVLPQEMWMLIMTFVKHV